MNDKGKIWKFGDDIDTDQILPSQYLVLPSVIEMSEHAMEPLMPDFSERYSAGDIIAAGKNFGCGSSREQAPAVLKEMGVRIIIAESFARIFFRNAINLGILLIELNNTEKISTGDTVNVTDSEVMNLTTQKTYDFIPLTDFLKNIVAKGGLVNYLRERV